MNSEPTTRNRSVGAVVLKGDDVLLVRHTYGAGKGRLIIPGGYIEEGETPQQALKREVLEETAVIAEPANLIGVRFNLKDWYAVFLMTYVSGTPVSDKGENSEALFMNLELALESPEVPDLTKVILRGVRDHSGQALTQIPFVSREKHGEYSYFGI